MTESKTSTLDETAYFRVRSQELNIFKQKTARQGRKYSEVLRELVEAYNDGRVVITMTDDQNKLYKGK